ncbi:MAG TPA: acyl carrier protein [Planctomycetaceae bacterium]|nr:acyl carrier protein [Planctomycetaceae bacterium]
MSPLCSALARLLEVESIEPGDSLRGFENWDSLTVLSLCATLDRDYGMSLSAQELNALTTVAELERLIAAHQRG